MAYIRILENFLEMLTAERSVSANTAIAYRTDIKNLLNFMEERSLSFETTTLDHLEEYLRILAEKQYFSSKTISRRISSIRQFFQFLLSEGLLKSNIAIDLVMPKKPADLPKALGQGEMQNLLQAAYADDTPDGVRTATMLELLYATGMRVTELLTLKIQALEHDVNAHGLTRYIIVKGKGEKERIVLLNDDAANILKCYLELRKCFIKDKAKSDWLFPSIDKSNKISHLTRQRFGQILKNLAINANVDPGSVSPHKIRHSFATHMLQNGANLRVVQELLGHADISSTQIYTKISDAQATKLVLEKHPLKDSK